MLNTHVQSCVLLIMDDGLLSLLSSCQNLCIRRETRNKFRIAFIKHYLSLTVAYSIVAIIMF